ncbi:hypothetical protein HELRODRAFT_181443 [Helobdella robusta]|uniref:Transient receptor ion channel domain-containing protein n=1 Tax=Helobdella robusta TaxID=6412 RepID=T1FH04_HELRO|nr:hypothetical protein HELRODRAFT_181443 [Helobdella robusta]ESN92395.1 hypothetical protein HELRODRAFT_181443 [Helobdella robusta]
MSQSSLSDEEVFGYYNVERGVFEISKEKIKNKTLFDCIKGRNLNGLSLYFAKKPNLKGLIHKIEDDDGNNLLAASLLAGDSALTNGLFICISEKLYDLMVIILEKQTTIKHKHGVKLKYQSHPPCIGRATSPTPITPNGIYNLSACHDYPPYLTPLMLACERNDLAAIQILVKYGHRLHRPHRRYCDCEDCKNISERSLIEALSRQHEYRALASSAYITVSSIDPIIHTFRLYSDLLEESELDPEYSDEYKSLASQCSTYVTSLISLCRTKGEVRILLSRQAEFRTRYSCVPFNRIQQALELKLRFFVANSNCQQVLADKWYGDDWSVRRMSSLEMFFSYVQRIVTLPFIACITVLIPYGPVAERCRIPVNKFLNEAASFSLFLILNLVSVGMSFVVGSTERLAVSGFT